MADPLSIAGLGLGVASLTAQAFVGCIQAIQLIAKAKNLKPEFQYLNIRLQLERQRLWNWSELCGLLEYLGGKEDALDTSLTGLNRHLILDVLLQIQTLATEFVKVKGRYQDLSFESSTQQRLLTGAPALDELTSPVEEAIGDASDFTQRIPGSRAAIRKLLRTLEFTQQLPRRLRWASWDQDKFKGLLDRLKELNDCLLDLVDNSIKMQIFLKTKETNINFLELHNRIDDLRQLFLALAQEPQTGSSRIPFGLHLGPAPSAAQLHEEENKGLRDLTRFKALSQSMENGSLDASVAAELQLRQPNEQMRDSRLDRADIELDEFDLGDLQSCEGLRCEARYQGHPVWVEWKEYQPVDFTNPKPAPNVLARVQKLAALLRKDENPAVFRVPHCLGYFDDAAQFSDDADQHHHPDSSPSSAKSIEDIPEPRFRFGFVFAKPRDVDPNTVPISLFDLLQTVRKPSLTSRVTLAKTLANCIRYLHSVNWLHKGLRSHNIIFFPRAADAEADVQQAPATATLDYTRPYLTGFDYARPAWREEMTEVPPANPEYDVYKHPRLLRAADRDGYRKAFDLYSLGIVFVEIALWESIDAIVGIADPKTARPTEISAIRQRLLGEERFMGEIDASMGLIYKSSVLFCLGSATSGVKGGLDGTGDPGAVRLNNEFYEKVVRQLEDIRC